MNTSEHLMFPSNTFVFVKLICSHRSPTNIVEADAFRTTFCGGCGGRGCSPTEQHQPWLVIASRPVVEGCAFLLVAKVSLAASDGLRHPIAHAPMVVMQLEWTYSLKLQICLSLVVKAMRVSILQQQLQHRVGVRGTFWELNSPWEGNSVGKL